MVRLAVFESERRDAQGLIRVRVDLLRQHAALEGVLANPIQQVERRLKLLTRKLLIKHDGLLYNTDLLLQYRKAQYKSAKASRHATQRWLKRNGKKPSHTLGQNGGKSLGEKDGQHSDAIRAHPNFEDF